MTEQIVLKGINLNIEVICKARNRQLSKAWWEDICSLLAERTFALQDRWTWQTSHTQAETTQMILTVWIVDDHYIQELNKNYRSKDQPTDVLSFPVIMRPDQGGGEFQLGDIFISINRLVSQAKEYEHSLQREGAFLYVHGLLHLLGYDHQGQKDERLMLGLQDRILEGLFPRIKTSQGRKACS